MVLNSDQEKALKFLIPWYKSQEKYAILDGAGGTGKTFVISKLIEKLSAKILVIAPTHEALKVCRNAIDNPHIIFKTVHSALGIKPIATEKTLQFDQVKIPDIWNQIDFCIADESSMYNSWILDLLFTTGVKILFVGHESQLPPVDENRKINDLCISPIFKYKFPKVTLKIPMRNSGKIFEFTQYLEEMIYDPKLKLVPNTFDKTKLEIKDFTNSETGRRELLEDTLKVVMWTNSGVKRYNDKIRKMLFGEFSLYEKYLIGDRIILTKPLSSIDGFRYISDSGLKKIAKDTESYETFYSNTKGTVIGKVNTVTIVLTKQLSIQCLEIPVNLEGEKRLIYEPIHSDDWKRINSYYDHLAFNIKDIKAKSRVFSHKFFVLSCFADILHYYAATAHRLQGRSITNIIVVNSDIEKNNCYIEKLKCRYVACSRASKNLMFYRG